MDNLNGRRFLFYLTLSLLVAGMAFSQETVGRVRGTVTDPTGAAVVNATVELVGPVARFNTTTDAAGAYQFAQVPPGTGYTLTVSAQGFSNAKAANVGVDLGRATIVDIKLEVGQLTESVVVSADAVTVDTQSSASAVAVDKSFFDLIPKGRSFYDLIAIAPGARQEGKAGGYEIDGASGSENTYYLDGMEVTNIQTGVLSGGNQIPVEMVQQVEIKNGVVPSQYGGAMGGVINAVVRSGSNKFHGEVGFYYNNDEMEGRRRPYLWTDPDDPDNMRPEFFQARIPDEFRTWEPIFQVGGPLLPNRVFFFSSYQPVTTSRTRVVDFLSGDTGTYTQKSTQQYMANKVDVVPFSKLRTNLTWIWNPRKNTGGMPTYLGTDAYDRPWSGFGEREAMNMLAGSADYIASSKLVLSFRAGYSYRNLHNNYGVSTPVSIYYSQDNRNASLFPGIPDNLRGASGYITQSSDVRLKDIYTRNNYHAMASYIFNLGGQHNIKGGWQRNDLYNDVLQSTWPTGYYRFWWSSTSTPAVYRCVTSQCSTVSGTYGYYRLRNYGEMGKASSQNQGIFVHDDWRVTRRLTLNLGLRFEREYVPVFATGANLKPIVFNWGDKVSPRLGFAYDVMGDGKQKLYASFGVVNDVMKYEMPRGSFGGNIWMDYMYTLDDPAVVTQLAQIGLPADPTKLPGKFGEAVNWRIPSHDVEAAKSELGASQGLLDPDLKPVATRLMDIGYEYTVSPTLVASARYTNRRLIRSIEDTGFMGAAGETYMITNPGENFPSRSYWTELWLGTELPLPPKPVRKYDAVEFRLDKRMSANYQFSASYTWSRLWGNYSGLASSDENGRTSPNVNRFFDMPWVGIDESGKYAYGRLATDRPHTFKFYGTYTARSKAGATTFSPYVQLYSGTPITTEANIISSTPSFPYGRGDLGRTPVFFQGDMNVAHEFMPFKSNEAMRVRFDFTAFNIFNNSTVTNRSSVLIQQDDAHIQFRNADGDDDYAAVFKGFNTKALMAAQGVRQHGSYGLDSGWQGPRSLRLRLSFVF